LCGTLLADVKPLVFAPLPMKDAVTIYETFAPMTRSLELSLDRKIDYHISESYEDLMVAIQKGEIDITYLGPLPYILAKEKNENLKPLVVFNESDSKPTYACVLVAWAPQKKQYELKNLNPKETTIALTSPLSTCGYYAVDRMLKRSEYGYILDMFRYRYLGKHDEVALAVVRGEFQYGGLKEDIANQYSHLGLEVVARLDNMPGFALIVDSNRVDPSLQGAIYNTLLQTKEEIYSHWGRGIDKGMRPASDEMYWNFKQILYKDQWRLKP